MPVFETCKSMEFARPGRRWKDVYLCRLQGPDKQNILDVNLMSSSIVELTGSENAATLSKDIKLSSSISSTAVAATVCHLQRLSNKRCQFAALRLLFLPPLDQNVSLPSKPLQDYFYELAYSAEAAAVTLACSSILAGQGSESDDFGDVSVWFGEGDFGKGREELILSKLGMETLCKECKVR